MASPFGVIAFSSIRYMSLLHTLSLSLYRHKFSQQANRKAICGSRVGIGLFFHYRCYY